jgi:1-aminocyclopropane-1-carboxylate deaminase/D-cysteine desulfhydrase-like pyridoxal-dependent ACC family enzyme
MTRDPAGAAAAAAGRLEGLERIELLHAPTEVYEMVRLREAIGSAPRLFVKRDDAIPFGFGGNKVRKLRLVAAAARAGGADTLLTVGGVQSNHARATAAVAAALGMRCVLVANGERPARLTGNALLNDLLGAEVRYVASREERMPAMAAAAEELRRAGRHPYEIPLGASTPLGALGFAQGVGELARQLRPDVIVHASSSGGTQAGILVGCAVYGLRPRVIGISADEPVARLSSVVGGIVEGAAEMLGDREGILARLPAVEVDDAFVGEGYGIPTGASREAAGLAARHEGFFVDHTYSAKALAGLVSYVRGGRIDPGATVLFWHTGGQPALFA